MKKEVQICHHLSCRIIEVSEVKSNENVISIKDLNLTEDSTLLTITQKRLTTMLNFTDAGDYQALYLNKNFNVVGGSFAIDNESGFILQSQEKSILLLKINEGNTTLKEVQKMMSEL